jgi:hypothetical protein
VAIVWPRPFEGLSERKTFFSVGLKRHYKKLFLFFILFGGPGCNKQKGSSGPPPKKKKCERAKTLFVSLFLCFKNTKTQKQRNKNTKTQKHKNKETKTQKHKNTKTKTHDGPKTTDEKKEKRRGVNERGDIGAPPASR